MDIVSYISSDWPSAVRCFPAKILKNVAACFTHTFTDGRVKQVIFGLKYQDPHTEQLFMQDRVLWLKQDGQREVLYLIPGESASDSQNPFIQQSILNALYWQSEV